MIGLPGKLRRLVDRLGWRVGALYLLHRVGRAATRGWLDLHCYRLVYQPVQSVPLLAERWRGAVTVRRLAADDPRLAEALSRREDLAPRLARGDVCLAAFGRDGRLAGYLWLCFGPFEDDETHCRFAPLAGAGGAWDYDLWVAPEARGGPVFAALWEAAWEFLTEQGRHWTASRVSAFNDQSLRAHRRLGARAIGTILMLSAGRRRLAIGSVGPRCRLLGPRSPAAPVPIRALDRTG